MNNQRGFTLLSVLILTAMSGIIVVSSLRDNIIQERLTGNYQKKMNARLVSEKGVFETHQALLDYLSNDPSANIDELIAAINENTDAVSNRAELENMSFNSSVRKNSDGLIEIKSIGSRFDGKNNTIALFEYVSGESAKSPFTSAISGCEGVTVGGGGKIDSYDSSLGDGNQRYRSDLASNGANVGTIYQNANITLSGGAPIWGSVMSTGDITLSGSAFIGQDIKANGNVTINAGPGPTVPGGYPNNVNIAGNVYVGEDLNFHMGTLLGFARIKGDFAYMGNRANVKIMNADQQALSLLYAGDLINAPTQWNIPLDFDDTPFSDPKYNVGDGGVIFNEVPSSDPSNPSDDPSDPDTNCDPLNIKSTIESALSTQTSHDLMPLASGSSLNVSKEEAIHSSQVRIYPTVTSILTFNNVAAYTFDQLDIANGTLRFKHSNNGNGGAEHIIVFVKGDFNHANDGAFIIDENVVVSIFVTGRIRFKKGLSPNSSVGVNQALKLPTLSFYSAYEGKSNGESSCNSPPENQFGVAITANSDIYASFYTPNTDVLVSANGQFSGAVRGNKVITCGDGDIHYDEALGKINVGGGSNNGSAKLIFKGWRYL